MHLARPTAALLSCVVLLVACGSSPHDDQTPTTQSDAGSASGSGVALVGPRWVLDEVVTAGDAERLPPGANASLQFAAGGEVQAELGCNQASTIAVVEGATMRLGSLVQTAMFCTAPGAMALEELLGTVLRCPLTWSVDDGVLTLTAVDGTGNGLVYVATEPTPVVLAPSTSTAAVIAASLRTRTAQRISASTRASPTTTTPGCTHGS